MSLSNFTGDIDFCPECGTILPLPGREDTVTCYVCKFSIDVKDFDGLTMTSEVIFNDCEKALKNSKKVIEETPSGPLIDRKCSKCGHEGMTYATLQTRSADEGQTVFYSCPNCKFQETENS